MKYCICLLILLILMCNSVGESRDWPYTSYYNKFRVIVIDSCEYIQIKNRIAASAITIVHKGNCKYCASRQIKLIEEIIRKINDDN